MKKLYFWLLIVASAAANGMAFYLGSADFMTYGGEDLDNAAALLFIPILWLVALGVIGTICVITGTSLFCMDIKRIAWYRLLKKAGRPMGEIRRNYRFLAVCIALMCFAYALFWPKQIYSAAYALSGGALLMLLYNWNANMHRNDELYM